MAVSDDDLIRMYRDGDADAFDTLFDRYYTSVFHFARMMLGNGGMPEEVLQETFLAVARTARRYTPRGRFRPWLMRIVRNRCLNRLEAERTRIRAMTHRRDLETGTPGERSPSELAEAKDEAVRLRAAIEALPDRQREAISLYAFEQMSCREIAEILESPVNTVKTLIHRARAALARSLAETQEKPNEA
jgi:RNA polymerase sigma-70 factor (ECF subfamily)